MRPNFPNYRLAAAAAIAAGSLCLVAAPRPASAVVPGGNGLIATLKCEDGVSCTARHIWTVEPRHWHPAPGDERL